MKTIDKYAYRSPLRRFQPTQKVLLGLMLLFTCLIGDSPLLSFIILILMTYLTLYKGGIPFKVYSLLMAMPFTFLILSLLPLLLDFSTEATFFVWSIHMFHGYMGISSISIELCLNLFFKTFASVSCLYFICLTTPMNDILRVFKKWHCPVLLLEMMALIYRFIFIIIDTAFTMYEAQTSRLGYINFRFGIRSFGILLSSLFVRTLKINTALYTSLECRGYTGSLNVLHEDQYKSFPYTYIFAIEGILIIILIVEKTLL